MIKKLLLTLLLTASLAACAPREATTKPEAVPPVKAVVIVAPKTIWKDRQPLAYIILGQRPGNAVTVSRYEFRTDTAIREMLQYLIYVERVPTYKVSVSQYAPEDT